jgi:transcription-repair coupling factor (superfamily II helicase)
VGLRLQLYRRLADLEEETDIEAIGEELTDRFGQLPEAVDGLLYQLRIKLLAQRAKATAVGNEAEQVFVRLPYLAEVDRQVLQHDLGNGVRVSRTAIWLPRGLDKSEWQTRLVTLLSHLAQPAKAT